HDAVPHDLVDGALVAVDGLHHPLQDGVEQLARLLGVAVGEELHGTLEVGEQDGDLLALALKRSLGRKDLFSEMLRRVGVRRGETTSVLNGNGAPAGPAELLSRGNLSSTLGADWR